MGPGIAFDLDGVLADSYDVWRLVLDATLTEFGHRAVSEREFHRHWGQGIEDDIAVWMPERTRGDVEAAYARHFPRFAGGVRVIEGAGEAVAKARSAGRRLAVVTNSPRAVADALLGAAGLTFDAVVTASDVARPKPAPDMVVEASRRLAVSVADLVVIGDSDFDEWAARAAGAGFVRYGGGSLANLVESLLTRL